MCGFGFAGRQWQGRGRHVPEEVVGCGVGEGVGRHCCVERRLDAGVEH